MKNLKNVIFWISIFLIITTTILARPLSNLDEIWNFNMSRCIAEGLVPYRDINMVITPLLSFITAIFLKTFGSEMIVTRILTVILTIIILGLFYKICKNIKIPKGLSYIAISAIMYIMKEYFCLDYNFLILAFGLIIILLEIKNNNYQKINKKLDLIIGFVGGLVICTKQTIGILLCCIIAVEPLILICKKEKINTILKIIGIRLIGILIPISILIIYLLINNAVYDFFDYCVLGIKTFSNRIQYSSLINSNDMLIKILSIAIPIIVLTAIVINVVLICKKKQNTIAFILTIYSLPILALVYPIADNIHFLISIIPVYLLIAYAIRCVISKIKKLKIDCVFEFIEMCTYVAVILFTILIEIENTETLSELSKYRNLSHFNNIYVSDNLYCNIEKIDKYITTSEKKVYILDSAAALYMIPINRYNKNYDLFLKGNLGSGGETKQIENIKSEDAKYMILNNSYSKNWQNPNEVTSFVKENLNYIETIGIYDVYENKN